MYSHVQRWNELIKVQIKGALANAPYGIFILVNESDIGLIALLLPLSIEKDTNKSPSVLPSSSQ